MFYYPSVFERYFFFQINGKYILKSGTDFRQFSVVTVNFPKEEGERINVEVEAVEVTAEIEPNNELDEALEKYKGKIRTTLHHHLQAKYATL